MSDCSTSIFSTEVSRIDVLYGFEVRVSIGMLKKNKQICFSTRAASQFYMSEQYWVLEN